MFTTTAQDLIAGSMKLLGVLADGETPTASEGEDGLDRLNALIDGWGLERLTIYEITRTTFTTTANDGEYSIGAGANINIVRPQWIDHAAYLSPGITPDTEVPLAIQTDQSYESQSQKTLTSELPSLLQYRLTSPAGTILLWPVPTQALTLVLYTPTAITQHTSLTASVVYPPNYERTLRYNLAVELAPEYGKTPSPWIQQQAKDSLLTLKQANYRMVDLGFDPAFTQNTRSSWNILTDP